MHTYDNGLITTVHEKPHPKSIAYVYDEGDVIKPVTSERPMHSPVGEAPKTAEPKSKRR